MTSNEFALAQQRLQARRLAREAETQTQLLAQQNTSRAHAQISRLPSSLRPLGLLSLSTFNLISGRSGTHPSFRVGQVDAELLDEELLSLLQTQVSDGLKYFGTHVHDDWSSEITLLLRAVLFKLSVWDHDATYGAALQNLRFTDARVRSPDLPSPSRAQKSIYGVLTVGGKYAWDKWTTWLVDHDDGYSEVPPVIKRLSRVTDLLSTFHSTAAFISFLVFLTNGRYRTLLDRVLRLRLAPPTSQVSREVSFEYLNRQLVWHAFTEFLLFVLPLVGISRWRRWLARGWRKTKALVRSVNSNPDENDGDVVKSGELSFLPERTCAICYQDQNSTGGTEAEVIAASGVVGAGQTDITNPYETVECGCVYCFVCLAGRLEAEEGEGWVCLRCGEEVRECRPWRGDVLEEVVKSNTVGKSVGFKDVPKEIVVVEPKAEQEDDSISTKDLVKAAEADGEDSPEEGSALGEDEAYDEEEEGEMEEDDAD